MSNITDKLARIIAKAESTTSPEEAQSFMAKVNQLLEEHGLSMLDIGRADAEDPVAVTVDGATYFAAEAFAGTLAGQIAKFYGCAAVRDQIGKNKYQVAVAGRESNRITFQLMFPFIMRQIRQLARQMAVPGYSESEAKTAIGNALSIRVHNMVKENENRDAERVRKAAAAGGSSTALVPVDLIKKAIDDHFGTATLKQGKARNLKTNMSAKAAAASVSLHRQTGGQTRRQIAG